MQIKTPPRFRFEQSLAYLNRSHLEPLHCIVDGRILKVLKINGQLVLISLGVDEAGNLQIIFPAHQPDDKTRHGLRAYVHEWFDLERDLSPFYELAACDKVLRDIVCRFRGLRLVRIPDLFQALCWAIIGQQINLKFAYTLFRRFVHSFGESHSWQGHTYWLFPRPEIVAGLSVADLVAHQNTRRKSEYLLGMAKLISDGTLSRHGLLAHGSFSKAKSDLLGIRGVGDWTANYVSMRCLGDPEAFPAGDVGLQQAIKLALNLEAKPGCEEINKLAAGWQGWQAYAAVFLYRSLI